MQLPYFPQDILELFLLGAFAIVFLIQMVYLWGFFRRLAFYRNKEYDHSGEAVSVVICARNELTPVGNTIAIGIDPAFDAVDCKVVDTE